MTGPKPYEFIGYGVTSGRKPYEIIGFGGIPGSKPYEIIGFGGIPQPGPGDRRGLSPRHMPAGCVSSWHGARDGWIVAAL